MSSYNLPNKMTKTLEIIKEQAETSKKIQELKELLEYQFSNLEQGINIHKKYNQPYNPVGDSFTEIIHACMYDTMCVGSAGQGWDTLDRGESKESNHLQSRKCNSCKEWDGRVDKNGNKIWKHKKVMFFNDKCPYCGSSDLTKYPRDGRWGIASKEHIHYNDSLSGYRLVLLEPETYSPDCRTFILRSWFIDAKDEYLTEYATRQYNSPKSDLINFQPLKQDFYRSSPCLHLEAVISPAGVDIKYFNINNDKVDIGPDKYYQLSMEEIMDKKAFGKLRGQTAR